MNRILLLGKNGRLGRELRRTLTPLGKVTAIDREEVDLSQPNSIRGMVADLRPSLIVNAAACNDIDGAEISPQLAFTINRDTPAILAEEAVRSGIPLVHYSTDFVFDGSHRHTYKETDLPNPLNQYGRSRMEGEQAVQSIGGQHLIFRSGWVYSLRGGGFVPKVLRWARETEALCGDNSTPFNSLVGFCYWTRERELLRVADGLTGSPTWAAVLAELTTLALMKSLALGPDWLASHSGLYHLAGRGSTSRLELAQTILTLYGQARGIQFQNIIPIRTDDFPTIAKRPAYTVLDSSHFETTFGLTVPEWQESLRFAISSTLYPGTNKSIERSAWQVEREADIARLNQSLADRNRQLTDIYRSNTWKLARIIQRTRVWVIPCNSRLEKVIRVSHRALRTWRRQGIKVVMEKIRSRFTSHDPYQSWIARNEPSRKDLEAQRQSSRLSSNRPLISIITPIYNTPTGILRATIQSVISQTYDNWELCIANGSPENREIRQLLDEFARSNPRIKVVHLDSNLGISGNTNAAINISSGDFIGFLDHDDLLAPFALFEIAVVLAKNPFIDMVYSDEDKISADGKERYGPFFKPSFNGDYLRSINYMPHFLVIRRSIGREVGWLEAGFEGAQDYDLILKVAEKARVIAHCPKILYHWRAIPGSTAFALSEKDYATESGIKALASHLRRMQIEGSVTQAFMPTSYRISYAFDKSTLVSIIIPNCDHSSDLELCVNSIIEKSTYQNFEILIIENNSQEEATFTLYRKLLHHPNIRLIEYHEVPFNYSNINNFAAEQARGDVLLFLNNDTEVISPDWMESMLEHVCRPDVGAVGAKLYYPDDTIQHGGIVIGIASIAAHVHKHFPRTSNGHVGRLKLQHNLSAVTAACLMVKRSVFDQVEGFDPDYRLAFGDVDFCLKVRREKHLIVWTPYAELYHHESKTRGYEDTEEKLQRYNTEYKRLRQSWLEVIDGGDEYYNPNLTLDFADMSIASKPSPQTPRLTSGFSRHVDLPLSTERR